MNIEYTPPASSPLSSLLSVHARDLVLHTRTTTLANVARVTYTVDVFFAKCRPVHSRASHTPLPSYLSFPYARSLSAYANGHLNLGLGHLTLARVTFFFAKCLRWVYQLARYDTPFFSWRTWKAARTASRDRFRWAWGPSNRSTRARRNLFLL